jgi:hypothetical protein
MFAKKMHRAFPAGVLAAAIAGVAALAGCPITTVCSPTDTSPACRVDCTKTPTAAQCQPQRGTILAQWTVNGQPAATGCPSGSNVRLTLDGAAPLAVACTTGQQSFPSLTVAAHTLAADLVDGAGTVLNNFPQTSINVVAGATANVSINFTPGGGGGMTGSAKFVWTVQGQPASTGCPANSTVKVESTAQPGTAVSPNPFQCNQGMAQIDGLAAGSYTFKLSLLDGSNPARLLEGVNLTVNAGAVAEATGLDFPAPGGGGGTGTVKLNWTVNNGQNCPTTNGPGNVTVTVSGGPTAVSPAPSASCSNFTITIPNLAAGTYTFSMVLSDTGSTPMTTAPVEVTPVEVMAGATAEPSPAANITCPFCPGS